MSTKVNWVGIEKIGEKRILDALGLALQRMNIRRDCSSNRDTEAVAI